MPCEHGPPSLRPLQSIDDAHSSLSGFASFSSDLDSIKANTADRIETLVDGHSDLAQTIDKWWAGPGPSARPGRAGSEP